LYSQYTSIQLIDRDGAKPTLDKLERLYPLLTIILAEGGYRGQLIHWVEEELGLKLEIVKRNDDVKGFEILPWRWIVERTFAMIEAWIDLSMFSMTSNRLESLEKSKKHAERAA